MRAGVLVAVSFVLLALLFAAWIGGGRLGRAPEPTAAADPAAPGAGTSAEPARGELPAPRADARAALPLDAAAPGAPSPGPRPRGVLAVEVRDADGRAIAGAEVELASDAGPHPCEIAYQDERALRLRSTSDAEGAATFADVPAGPYALRAAAPDGRSGARRHLHAARAQLDSPARIVVAEAAPGLLVRVVDARGAGVPGASVRLVGATREEALERALRADGGGRARFEAVEPVAALVLASTDDGRVGRARVEGSRSAEYRRRGGLEVALAAPGVLEGALLGGGAELLRGARVVAHALTAAAPYDRTYGARIEAPVADGRYRFDALAAGEWTLALEAPGGARLALPRMKWGDEELPNSLDPLEVEVASGRTTRQDLHVVPGGAITGRARRPDGAPVADAEVCLTLAPRTSNFPDGYLVAGTNVWRYDDDVRVEGRHPVTHPRARTDRHGGYRFAGLAPGLWRVEVLAPGLAYDRREEVEVADGSVAELEHVLADAGAIQGVERERGTLGVTRFGEERPRMLAVLSSSGAFAFPGLEAGRYTLAKFLSHAGLEPVPLAEVDVVAGRTTWVDLADAPRPVAIRGRVVGARGPVEGARVTLMLTSLATDAAGRFETRRSFPLTGGPLAEVTVAVEHGGVETILGVPPMSASDTRAEWELALGAESAEVLVLDALGGPAEAAVRLVCSATGAELGIRSVRVAERAVDGAATLSDLAPGEYTAYARFEDGAEVRVPFTLPTREPVVLRAPASGHLVARVTLADGGPAAEWWVTCLTWTGAGPAPADVGDFGESFVSRRVATDDAGLARLSGIAAGELAVQAYPKGAWGATGEERWERLTLRAGEERTVELVVEAPARPPR